MRNQWRILLLCVLNVHCTHDFVCCVVYYQDTIAGCFKRSRCEDSIREMLSISISQRFTIKEECWRKPYVINAHCGIQVDLSARKRIQLDFITFHTLSCFISVTCSIEKRGVLDSKSASPPIFDGTTRCAFSPPLHYTMLSPAIFDVVITGS